MPFLRPKSNYIRKLHFEIKLETFHPFIVQRYHFFLSRNVLTQNLACFRHFIIALDSGATTLSLMPFSLMPFSIMTFSLMPFSIMTFSIMKFSKTTFSLMPFSIMTFSIMKFSKTTLRIMTFSLMTFSLMAFSKNRWSGALSKRSFV
jgi:hypothetical protein